VLTSNIQASGSSEQASIVAEITATMEELARTAAQIAENSNKVAKQAEDSDDTSKEGFSLVNNVIQAIETIDAKMSQISQKTQVLGTQSKQIGKVLDIIYDIANETHLLALNAPSSPWPPANSENGSASWPPKSGAWPKAQGKTPSPLKPLSKNSRTPSTPPCFPLMKAIK